MWSDNRHARLLYAALCVLCIGGCLSGGGKSTPVPSNGPVSISVDPSNSAPAIWGFPPPAVMIENTYSFTPSTADPDGDRLSFSIQNQPRWTIFDAATGRLSGQPVLGDEGVYERIRITVSDGLSSVSLQEFSITVTQTALGSMTLSWMPPTENADGTPLTNLAGYKIYFGMSAGNYTSQIRIDNPSISTYLIENLLPGTYYLVATSFNTLGIESSYSNVAVKTVASE